MKAPPYSKDLGLFVIRAGIGGMFILHGLPKLLSGPSGWEGLAQYGMPFLPTGIVSIAIGLLAAVAEAGGGLLLLLGLWHRIACAALIATMAVAFAVHLPEVSGWSDFAKTAGWPLELIFVFVGLFFAGTGRYKIGA